MKRHPDLREFSDDHHQGLVNALRLKRAASGEGVTPEKAARTFLKFWREDTSVQLFGPFAQSATLTLYGLTCRCSRLS